MSHKIIICALNGIGSFGNPIGAPRGKLEYLTHTIDRELDRSPAWRAFEIVRAYGKGGPDPKPERTLLEAARAYNSPENVLLLAGFSYGARDIVRDVAWPLYEGPWGKRRPLTPGIVKYRRVELVTVDPDWFAGLFNHRKTMNVPWQPGLPSHVTSLYQTNSWPGGTRITLKASESDYFGQLTQIKVDCPKHRDMDTRPETAAAIYAAIGRLVDSLRTPEAAEKGKNHD